jgi:tetratricopeptide (TPR) repeat protein
MNCSFNETSGQPRILRALALTLLSGAVFAGPAPINTDFDELQILVTLPEPSLATTAPPSDPEQLADLIQAQIQQARSTGDPRFLGYAEGLLHQWDGSLTDRLRVLKATIDQSNHRFDIARNGLNDVLKSSTDRRQSLQALLMLANMELVQGRYDSAAQLCDQLTQRLPGLIAASCQAQAMARTGQAESANAQLKQHLGRSRNAPDNSRIWALGTLGDIAAQLDDPAAETHWRQVLAMAPDDLYTRAQLAEWHLSRGESEQTLALTKGYEAVDSLAVIRAIAMKQAGHPDAKRLSDALAERFAEARWRGNLLHQRDIARYQLDITGETSQALEHARTNWTDQREPADTRLLLRAASAAGDTNQLAAVREWLTKHDQRDARYPEADL